MALIMVTISVPIAVFFIGLFARGAGKMIGVAPRLARR
jgi:hypothetical protein